MKWPKTGLAACLANQKKSSKIWHHPKRHSWPWCHRISHVYCFGEATQRLTHHRNHLGLCGDFFYRPRNEVGKFTWKKCDFEVILWLLKVHVVFFCISYVRWIQRFKIKPLIHPEWIIFNHNISHNLKSNIIVQVIPSLKPYCTQIQHWAMSEHSIWMSPSFTPCLADVPLQHASGSALRWTWQIST